MKLGFIEEPRITAKTLKDKPFMVIDTKFFGPAFKYNLLSGMDEIDEATDGLLVHSENFQALDLLQERYQEQVKCVYIDPPYNTERDHEDGSFIYKDNFATSSWLPMVHDRVLLSWSLLRDDGLLFSSIDHNEIASEKKILERVFGTENFEALISWRRRHNQPNDKTKMIGLVSEYLLGFAKDSTAYKKSGVGKLDLTGDFSNPDDDPKGEWASKPWKVGSDQSGSRYKITTPSGRVLDEEWMGDEDTFNSYLEEKRIYFPKSGDGNPRKKYYRFERQEEGQCATNWWSHDQFGHNQGANDTLTALFGYKNAFSNPEILSIVVDGKSERFSG